MRLEKYKGFIIIGNSIWFDSPDYKTCNSLMIFAKKDQIKDWIDEFHERYSFVGDRYVFRR